MLEYTRPTIKQSCHALAQLGLASKIIFFLQTCLSKPHQRPLSSIYIDALTSDFVGSPSVRELLLTLKKLSSNGAKSVLEAVAPTLEQVEDEALRDTHASLLDYVTKVDESSKPLRSEFSITADTLRISIVSRKAGLHKQKSTFSDEELKYSKLLLAFHDALYQHFEKIFADPNSLPFIETILFDYRAMHRSAFMPRTRQVIDRALTSPHDYLNCDCCQDIEVRHSSRNRCGSELTMYRPL